MVASGRLSQDDFNAAYKGWSDPAKTAAQAHMKSSFNNNFADPDEIKRRRMFTMATGKIKDGFTDTGTGSINTPAAETYIQKMTPYQMGNVYEDADLEYTGEHITAGQLFSIRGELSGYQKKKIKDGVLKGTNAQAITFVNTNQGWMNL